MRPLSHHEIVLQTPAFSEAGFRVDLTASDRAARLLVFRPVETASAMAASDCLVLELPEDRSAPVRLLRQCRHPGCPVVAELETVGMQPADAVPCLLAVAAADLFLRAGTAWIACSYRWLPGSRPSAAGQWRFRLAEAVTAAGRVRLEAEGALMDKGCDYAFIPKDADRPLPADLVAVLGTGWRVMGWRGRAWRGEVRSRRPPEQLAQRLVWHLSTVLAEPPAAFHARFRSARWGVWLRQLAPTLWFLALVAALVAPLVLVSGFQAPGWFIALSHPFMLLGVYLVIRYDLRLFAFPGLPRPIRRERW